MEEKRKGKENGEEEEKMMMGDWRIEEKEEVKVGEDEAVVEEEGNVLV